MSLVSLLPLLLVGVGAAGPTTEPLADPVMTGTSWAFMLTAWACVGGLLIWCSWRVLGGGPKT